MGYGSPAQSLMVEMVARDTSSICFFFFSFLVASFAYMDRSFAHPFCSSCRVILFYITTFFLSCWYSHVRAVSGYVQVFLSVLFGL